MGQVFISYSRADKAFADQLRADLEKRGADVWIDVDDIPVGEKWSSAVQQGLDACTVMIVILSPEATASKNVEDEWQYFLDQDKPLVPVLLRPTKAHFQISRIQYIDFSQQPYRTAFDALCAELQRNGVLFTRQKPVPPPAPVMRRQDAVPLPHSFPYSAAPEQARHKPTPRTPHRRSLLPLIVLLILVGIAAAVYFWVWPDPEPEPGGDDPAEVVQVYFSALEAKDIGLLEEIMCPGAFEDAARMEYEQLFMVRNYHVFEFEVLDVVPVDEVNVMVGFHFALEIEEAGVGRQTPGAEREFHVMRRNGDPDDIWCSTDFLLGELHG